MSVVFSASDFIGLELNEKEFEIRLFVNPPFGKYEVLYIALKSSLTYFHVYNPVLSSLKDSSNIDYLIFNQPYAKDLFLSTHYGALMQGEHEKFILNAFYLAYTKVDRKTSEEEKFFLLKRQLLDKTGKDFIVPIENYMERVNELTSEQVMLIARFRPDLVKTLPPHLKILTL